MFPVETCAAPRPWAPQSLQKNDVMFSLPCYTTPTTHPHTFLSTPQHRALPLPAPAGAGWPQAVSTWDELYWNHSEPEGTAGLRVPQCRTGSITTHSTFGQTTAKLHQPEFCPNYPIIACAKAPQTSQSVLGQRTKATMRVSRVG